MKRLMVMIMVAGVLAAAFAGVALAQTSLQETEQTTLQGTEQTAPQQGTLDAENLDDDAAPSLVNGNFETGDLTGWTVDTTASGGTARAVTEYTYVDPSCRGEIDCPNLDPILPQEGSYFALLTPGAESVDTMISQPFEASNGDKVSGWAFFNAEDLLPFDDKGQVMITNRDSGTTVATPFEESVSSVGDFGNSGWKPWEYTFSGVTGTGTFQIEARVHNTGDSDAMFLSHLGLDDVKASTSTNDPDTTSPETSMSSGPSGRTNDNSPTFTFSGSDEVTTTANLKYQYRVDGGDWSTPPSTSTTANLTGLSDGAHLFEVKAVDEAGNEDASPAQQSFTVDATSPKVTGTTPAADARRVGRSTNVWATFSEALDSTTVTQDALKDAFLLGKGALSASQLTPTTRIASTVSYDPTALSAKLDPYGSSSTRLAKCKWHTVKVTSGIKDLAGNQLDQDTNLSGLQPKVWYFKTNC